MYVDAEIVDIGDGRRTARVRPASGERADRLGDEDWVVALEGPARQDAGGLKPGDRVRLTCTDAERLADASQVVCLKASAIARTAPGD